MALDITQELIDYITATSTGFNSIFRIIQEDLNEYYANNNSAAEQYWYLLDMKKQCNLWLTKRGETNAEKKKLIDQLLPQITKELSNLRIPTKDYLDNKKTFLVKSDNKFGTSVLGAYTLDVLTKIYEKDLAIPQLTKKEVEILKLYVKYGLILLPNKEKEFKERLNFLLGTGYNKRGEGSSACLTRGKSLSFDISFDFAKLFIPVEGVSLEGSVNLTGKRSSERVIAIERQNDYSTIQKDTGNDMSLQDKASTYCLMNMIGWSGGLKLGAKITASLGVEAKTSDIIQNMEIASLSLTAKIEASVEAAIGGMYLTISDKSPKYYDSVLAMETPIFNLVNKLPPNYASVVPAVPGITLWSHAYDLGSNIGAYTGAKAEIGIESLSCQVDAVNANITATANLKISYYRFQSITDPSTKIIKIQDTRLLFKQVGITASAKTGLKLQAQSQISDNTIGPESTYNAINTIAYESAIAVWAVKTPKFLSGSGYVASTSVSVFNLNRYYANPEASEEYLSTLAASLYIPKEQLSDFLEDYTFRELYADVTQQYPGALFIEASFAHNLEEPVPLENNTLPKNFRTQLKKTSVTPENLESIRLCYRREDHKDNSYSRFKLGLNLGITKLNIDLGKIESVGTSEMINLYTKWIKKELPLNQSVVHPRLFM